MISCFPIWENAPAIGFVVVVDDVLEALSRQNKKPHTGLDGCLLFYTPDSYDAALKRQISCGFQVFLQS